MRQRDDGKEDEEQRQRVEGLEEILPIPKGESEECEGEDCKRQGFEPNTEGVRFCVLGVLAQIFDDGIEGTEGVPTAKIQGEGGQKRQKIG